MSASSPSASATSRVSAARSSPAGAAARLRPRAFLPLPGLSGGGGASRTNVYSLANSRSCPARLRARAAPTSRARGARAAPRSPRSTGRAGGGGAGAGRNPLSSTMMTSSGDDFGVFSSRSAAAGCCSRCGPGRLLRLLRLLGRRLLLRRAVAALQLLGVKLGGEVVVALVDVEAADDRLAVPGDGAGDLITHDGVRIGMRRSAKRFLVDGREHLVAHFLRIPALVDAIELDGLLH